MAISYGTRLFGGGGTGGGVGTSLTTQVLFNNAGVVAGHAGLTYDAATDTLTVGRITSPSGTNGERFGNGALAAGQGQWNTAFGAYALNGTITGGDSNTAVGFRVLETNTTGDSNTAVGSGALLLNTTANFNAAFGVEALGKNTVGQGNTAIGGYDAMLENVDGDWNTAVGYGALKQAVSADSNTAVGTSSLQNVTGGRNVAIGAGAGNAGTAMIGSIFIGTEAGLFETGSYTLIVDSINRASESAQRAAALMYGVMGATPAGQTLRVNAGLTVNGPLDPQTIYPYNGNGDTYDVGTTTYPFKHGYFSRATLGSKSKALTDATPTAFATVALADGGETGGKLIYRVVATDGGTARQVVSGSLNYAAVHVGAGYVVDYDEVQQSTAVSSGTLTGAVTAAAASDLLTFSANFDTDLGTPVLTIYYRFDSTNAADSITPL